jgi:Arc/MetJ-type ribon-helix-helix transcriptional regulator
MTINLPPDLEQVVSQAVASGSFASPDEVLREALSLLRRHIEDASPSNGEQGPKPLANKEWKGRLRDWIARHPARDHFVDVSRESIYSGRGE